jgi:hypothetical protein
MGVGVAEEGAIGSSQMKSSVFSIQDTWRERETGARTDPRRESGTVSQTRRCERANQMFQLQ